MATTASRMLDIARSQLGVGETPPGSNYTKYGKWYGLNGMAWCAMFMSWCANQAGALDIIPKHAYTPTGAKWFYDRKQWGTTPKVGALVYFAFYGPTYGGRWKGIHHVGIVESIRPDGRVVCIEGNASNRVARVVRSRSGIAGYGYPKYTTTTPSRPAPPEEDTPVADIYGYYCKNLAQADGVLKALRAANMPALASKGGATPNIFVYVPDSAAMRDYALKAGRSAEFIASQKVDDILQMELEAAVRTTRAPAASKAALITEVQRVVADLEK